jgi:hypothetical protein
MIFNVTVSTKNGRFAVFDLKNFYLGVPTRIWEYTRIHISTVPHSIISQNKLLDLFHNGYVLVEIMEGITGLLKPYSSFMNNFSPTSQNTAMPHAHTCQAFGNTQHAMSLSVSWSIILASNIPTNQMPITSLMPYGASTKSQQIGLGHSTLDSPYSGTTMPND